MHLYGTSMEKIYTNTPFNTLRKTQAIKNTIWINYEKSLRMCSSARLCPNFCGQRHVLGFTSEDIRTPQAELATITQDHCELSSKKAKQSDEDKWFVGKENMAADEEITKNLTDLNAHLRFHYRFISGNCSISLPDKLCLNTETEPKTLLKLDWSAQEMNDEDDQIHNACFCSALRPLFQIPQMCCLLRPYSAYILQSSSNNTAVTLPSSLNCRFSL